MGDGRLNISIAGLGGHGKTLQRAIDESGRYRVVSVFDPREAEAREAAGRFNCKTAPAYEALLDEGETHAVVLVSPNHLHVSQAKAAFEAGKHVFVEKPIANTTADGREMIASAAEHGLQLMVGHNMRFGRAARKAAEYLQAGALGEVVSFEIHFSADNTKRMPADAWRLDPAMCPLMPMMQLGIHAVDLIHFLVDETADVHAFARAVTTTSGALDACTASVRTRSGIIGTVVSNYCTQVTFWYRISGTEGTLECTPHTARFRKSTEVDGAGEGPFEVHDFRKYDLESYVRQMTAFADAVTSGTPVSPDGLAGLRALAVVEGMQESINAGGPVSVVLPEQT